MKIYRAKCGCSNSCLLSIDAITVRIQNDYYETKLNYNMCVCAGTCIDGYFPTVKGKTENLKQTTLRKHTSKCAISLPNLAKKPKKTRAPGVRDLKNHYRCAAGLPGIPYPHLCSSQMP